MTSKATEVDEIHPQRGTASKRKEKGDLKQPPEDYLHVLEACVEDCVEEKQKSRVSWSQGSMCQAGKYDWQHHTRSGGRRGR